MNKYVTVILALFLMQGATTAQAGDVVSYISVGGGQVVTEYVENGPSGGVSMKKSTWGTFIKAGVDLYQYTGFEVRGGLTGKIQHDFPAGTLSSIPPSTSSSASFSSLSLSINKFF